MKVTFILSLRGPGCFSFLLVLVGFLFLNPSPVSAAAISTTASSTPALEIRAADTVEHNPTQLDILHAELIEISLNARDSDAAEHNFAIVCQRFALDSRDQTALCQASPWYYGCDQTGRVQHNVPNTRCTFGCRCVNIRLGCNYRKVPVVCSYANETSDSVLVNGTTFADPGTIDSDADIDGTAPDDRA